MGSMGLIIPIKRYSTKPNIIYTMEFEQTKRKE